MNSAPDKTPTESEKITPTSSFFNDIINNPVNILLCAIIILLIYKILKSKLGGKVSVESVLPELPKIRKDMTVNELRQYDGTQPDGRVLVAVNGWIFDVTRSRRFYGPGGTYAAFGGKDASRGLALFSVTLPDREYDDLSDLNSMQMDSVREWEAQFREKYDLVGKLLKPGEEATNYSDEEPEETDNSTSNAEDKKEQ